MVKKQINIVQMYIIYEVLISVSNIKKVWNWTRLTICCAVTTIKIRLIGCCRGHGKRRRKPQNSLKTKSLNCLEIPYCSQLSCFAYTMSSVVPWECQRLLKFKCNNIVKKSEMYGSGWNMFSPIFKFMDKSIRNSDWKVFDIS